MRKICVGVDLTPSTPWAAEIPFESDAHVDVSYNGKDISVVFNAHGGVKAFVYRGAEETKIVEIEEADE